MNHRKLPQRLRALLWQANAVLAILAVGSWTWALAVEHDEIAPLGPAAHVPVQAQETYAASVDLDELKALSRPFHPWGERTATSRPPPAPPPPNGCLPLAALACVGWVRDGAGPDMIILKSKDPAHPEFYLPCEGEPDGGIEIQRIERPAADRGGDGARVTVGRGAETFTYTLRSGTGTPPTWLRIRRAPAASSERLDGTLAQAPEGPAPVKLVPFYDERGALLGAKVTGVRPGSRLASLGLERGDVVVGLGSARVASVYGVQRTLRSHEAALSIEVLRGHGSEVTRLRLDGQGK